MSPSPGDALRRLVELEEGDDAARVALLVAEVGVVAERRLEVERVLDEPQPHDPAPEVHVGHDVAGDPGEVVRSLEWLLHAISSSFGHPENLHIRYSRQYLPPMTLTAPRTIAGQVAERLKAEILAGERARGERAAPGGDRPAPTASAPRRCAKRWRRCSARGSSAPSAARRGRLPADRRRPAPPLRDPRRARGAGRGQDRRALRARVGAAAGGAAGPDARRPARGELHRAQPALPHDALRALRPPRSSR